MQKVFLTGASSFLGRSLGERLLENGCDLHVLARDSTDVSRLPSGLRSESVYIYDGSTESIVSALDSSKPDVIYHLASLYLRDTSVDTVEPLVKSNLLLGIQLMEAIRCVHIVASIVNFGTYTQYYQGQGEIQSLNVYAALKNAFADILDLYAEEFGNRHLHLILYDSYGTGDWREKLLPALKRGIKCGTGIRLSDPTLTIDLTHIDDVVSAAVEAGRILTTEAASQLSRRTYSISGDRLSLLELVTKVEEVTGCELCVEWNAYPLPQKRIIVPWLGSRLPNWKPIISLDEGLKSYLVDDAIQNQ